MSGLSMEEKLRLVRTALPSGWGAGDGGIPSSQIPAPPDFGSFHNETQIVSSTPSSNLGEDSPLQQQQQATSATKKPWDIVEQKGIGTPNPTTGKYSSYECKFYPGSLGGVIPSNMFDPVTLSGSGMRYLVLSATTGNGGVTNLTISLENSHPELPKQQEAGPPPTFKYPVGVFVEEVYFNVAAKNLALEVAESLRVSDSSQGPFGLPYKSYYTWRFI
jgi:hypothetical protein